MPSKTSQWSRREREIMDIIYARGQASASDVHTAMIDAPSYSTVRALLRILEEKGHLCHREDGARYIYRPTESREKASRSALRQMLKTFFNGSLSNAVAALVDAEGAKLSDNELKRLESIVKAAKNKSR
jgi:predicted transcriptional regulator